METEITVSYTVCDNMLKTMNFRDDCQAGMNTAEVMTVVLTAARFFCGSIRTAACSHISDFPRKKFTR